MIFEKQIVNAYRGMAYTRCDDNGTAFYFSAEDFEGLSREHAVRMLDYLSGAIKAVGGIMTKVGRTTLVIAPKNVDVSSIEAMVNGD